MDIKHIKHLPNVNDTHVADIAERVMWAGIVIAAVLVVL